MALFGGKKKKKPDRPDPRDREKKAGTRAYEARHQERIAAQRESAGDADGAKVARDAADEARKGPEKPGR